MKRFITVFICIFLSLVLISASVFSDYNYGFGGTVDAVTDSFDPIVTAFEKVTNIVSNYMDKHSSVVIDEEFVYSDIINNIIHIVETRAYEVLTEFDTDISKFQNQAFYNLRVGYTNLHVEHKVANFNLRYKSGFHVKYNKYTVDYCAVCSKVVSIVYSDGGGSSKICYPQIISGEVKLPFVPIGKDFYLTDEEALLIGFID